MKIERIVLRQLQMPLVHFFETSFGRTYTRDIIIVEVVSDGLSGWGEVTAGENPFYNEEWTESAWAIIKGFVAPRVIGYEFGAASEVGEGSVAIQLLHRMFDADQWVPRGRPQDPALTSS